MAIPKLNGYGLEGLKFGIKTKFKI